MRRIGKWAVILLGILVVLAIVAVGTIYALSSSRMSKRYDVQVEAPPVPTDAASIEEGKRLFTSRGCSDCHGPDLSGATFLDDPMVGRYTGANLTKGKGGIGGAFADADFVRAIRHGVAPDGRSLIFMPATDFHNMSDTDVGLLIAYIRSVPPVDKPAPVQAPGPIARLLLLAGQMPYLVPASVIDHTARPAQVTVGATVEYGRYLAEGCTGCHGVGFSGGPIPGGAPDWPPAANITPDAATGMGKWSEADFVKVMREGLRPDGAKIRLPMPWQNFSHMTETELKALWMYLSSVPAKPRGNR